MRKLVHKISVDQASMYFSTGDSKYLSKKLFRKGIEAKFVNEFNLLFNEKEIQSLLNDERLKLIIYNKAYNFYPAMHEAIRLGSLTGNLKLLKKMFALFKSEFNMDFTKLEDLEIIRKKMKKFRTKYKSMQGEVTEEKFDFDELVFGVEQLIGRSIDREMKLYQFKVYYDKALTYGRNSTVSK